MPTQDRTFVLPLRTQSAAAGSIYIPIHDLAQPAVQPSTRSFPMSRNLSQRIDRILTAIAMVGLLSPLVLASAMVAVAPH